MKLSIVLNFEVPNPEASAELLLAIDPPRLPYFVDETHVVPEPHALELAQWLAGEDFPVEHASPRALELGVDLAVGIDAMLVHTYAVHAAMLEQAGPNLPRNPTIMVDLEGFVDAGSPFMRLLIPEPLAIAIRDGVNVSLAQLERIRKADGQ